MTSYRSSDNSDASGVGCGSIVAGILIGFWVAFTFNFAIILCIVIGMGASVTYSILAGLAVLIARELRN